MNAKTAQWRTLKISKSQTRHKKSYQGKLCRVYAEGWDRSFTAIESVFIKCSDINDLSTYNELLDEWGFRRDNIASSHNILH